MNELKIGDTVWWRDENHRVYETSNRSPFERGYWRNETVIGESPRLWLLSGYAGKIPKKGELPFGYARDDAELERYLWVFANSYKIGEAVRMCAWGTAAATKDAFDKLKAVAEILNYTPKAPE